MKEKNRLVFFFGILVFIFFILYAYYSTIHEYILDSIIAIIVITILFLLRKQIQLTAPIFFTVILAFAAHNAGVFGWYNISPFIIQYDHLTHLIGNFAAVIIIYRTTEKFFSSRKLQNLLLLVFMFLASLGVGALIEQVEYIGYLKFGTGEGLLRFGGLGDTTVNEEQLRAMDIIGGGWINTMIDLNYNFLGSLIGLVIMHIANKLKYRNKYNKK